MKTPKVSVILPCYNVAQFMEPMFTSLRNQTMKDIEIIAINDVSTDNSLNVLDELSLFNNSGQTILFIYAPIIIIC